MDDGSQWDVGTYGAPYAAEASELGRRLDSNHAVETSGPTPLPGACGVCGFLVYEPAESIWWHLPPEEEFSRVRSWLDGNRR